MDAFARGLKIAAAMRKDGRLAEFVKQRYSSWDQGFGLKVAGGNATLEDCDKHVQSLGGRVAMRDSGRQEMLENIVNELTHLA